MSNYFPLGGKYVLPFDGQSSLIQKEKNLERKTVIIFLPMNLNMCFGRSKDH